MGSLEPKERIKRNGSKGRVKEDCILEDKTGMQSSILGMTLLQH